VPALVVANDTAELRRLSEWLVSTASGLGVPGPLVGELEVCANEAVTNVISYAWDDNGLHEISLRIAAGDGRVTLEIEDDGRPYNPLDMPEPRRPSSLLDAPVGGLGVSIIRKMMPASRYERREGRNVLTLIAAIG